MDFINWYRNIPVVTRTYLTLCIAMSFGVTYGMIELTSILNRKMYLYDVMATNWASVLHPLTWVNIAANFFYFDSLSINLLFRLHFLYICSSRLERGHHQNNHLKYLCILLLACVLIHTIANTLIEQLLNLRVLERVALFLRHYNSKYQFNTSDPAVLNFNSMQMEQDIAVYFPFLSFSLSSCMHYLWCKRYANEEIELFFVISIPSRLLPFVILLLSLTLSENIHVVLLECIGIVVGHLLYFVSDALPPILSATRNSIKEVHNANR